MNAVTLSLDYTNEALCATGIKKTQKEQGKRPNTLLQGITDKIDLQIGVDFSSELGGKPDAEWCSVEDLPTKCGQKRCVKMARLNLSVLP